ncbi:coiled-coil domain-containing protein SCD2-like [Curcuma longa]|uniref:coiled-coil domain-containing protein SCD2-like n=1 Tax=Curcuma longa TaxID=136217 RepID=UPI003D9F1667
MDRMRAGSPAYSRQGSGGSSGSGSSSPGFSPGHSRSASASSLSGIRRTQNLAAKAASARLAQVMASQATDDEDEDDLVFASGFGVASGIRHGLPRQVGGSNGGVGAATSSPSLLGRSARSPSPALGRNFVESVSANRSSSVGRTTLPGRMTPMVPQAKTTVRSPSPIPAIEPPVNKRIGKRFPEMGMGPLNPREPSDRSEAFALQDKLDMVEEENYNLLEKLQLAEERCKEAEARSRELEKQVANLGEGVSLEARLLSRKEAALRQREEAIKSAIREKDENSEELTALRQQLESARDESATIMDQFKGVELEINALSSMTQRMVLSQEEMEEVVLKRCWLARYWALAVQHGIYPEIAAAKHEYWSSLAPIPLEVVTSAGQKAKDELWSNAFNDSEKRNKLGRATSDAMAEGNIESMLVVEKGLRELASLKVEDAVVLALAEHRRPNLLRQSAPDFKSPRDPKFMEAFELSQEEMEDVLFKQSWLTYFWRRAKTYGVEEDIAEDRLQFWIDRMGQSPTSHDVVDVERGLIELRKLGIEQQLWEACRREIDAHQKPPADAEESL